MSSLDYEIEPRVGGWLQTHSGLSMFPLDPRPCEIEIMDIARALSHQCRYAGHTTRFYSVAEHSVYVSWEVPPQFALWGLLHDASEAFLVDIPAPLKPFMPDYKEWENNLMEVIAAKFGLAWPEPAAVKAIDTRILHNEKRDVMKTGPRPWNIPGQPIPDLFIQGWEPEKALKMFLARYNFLITGVHKRKEKKG
jgi:hypothetical protein